MEGRPDLAAQLRRILVAVHADGVLDRGFEKLESLSAEIATEHFM